MKDHLGSTRVSFNVPSTTAVIVQQDDYYPFGMLHKPQTTATSDNRYLYNGKELQNNLLGGVNLDLYDYGARFYDPQIGRWHTIDPLAETSRRWSPYSYCYNNPIIFIDPDGMWPNFMPGNLDRKNKKEWNTFENESSNDIFGSRGGSPIDRFNREKRNQFGNHIPEDDEWDRIREESGMPQDIAKRDKPKKNRPIVTKEDAEKFWAEHPNFFLISAIFELFIPGPSEFAKFSKLGILSTKAVSFERQLAKKGILGLTEHASKQMVERKFTQEAVLKIITEGTPKEVVYYGSPQIHYTLGKYTVVTPITGRNKGTIITVMGDYNEIEGGIRGIFTGF